MEQGFIRETPCKHVILPKRRQNRKAALDEEQIREFLSLIDTKEWSYDLKTIIKVLLFTGMRSGECLGLTWSDLDFDSRMITIRHTLADIGGKHFLTPPKTESSIRTISY